MDHEERDPRDWPEADRPEGAADQPTSEQAPPPTPAEPEAPEPDAGPEPEASQPAAADIESWPSQESQAPEPEPTAPESAPWPTEPPAADARPEEGAWPTSAPERGDEAVAGEPAPEPAWPSEESAAAGAAAAAGDGPPPAEAEADTAESAWTAAGAGAAAGAAEPEPAPSEAEAYPAAGAAAAATAGVAAHGVPDAEAAVGESTQCPRCGTENRPGLAFCRNCGQRLVAAGVATTVERPGTPEGSTACPRCGTHNRAGVAFCQNCGANLRGTAPGYVPPAVAGAATAEAAAAERRGAVLGPVVLVIGIVGLVTGYLLPFAYGRDSLYERAFGPGGYGIAFWTAYPSEGSLADTLYFGLAAPVPILAGLLAILAVAGFVRARPGTLQTPGLIVALAWSVGLIVLFVVVEVLGNWSGGIVDVLRVLTPGGIIIFLASLIVLIGTLTRFGRS